MKLTSDQKWWKTKALQHAKTAVEAASNFEFEVGHLGTSEAQGGLDSEEARKEILAQLKAAKAALISAEDWLDKVFS